MLSFQKNCMVGKNIKKFSKDLQKNFKLDDMLKMVHMITLNLLNLDTEEGLTIRQRY